MASAGVDSFYEVGARKVLSGLVKRIADGAHPIPIGTPDEDAAFKTARGNRWPGRPPMKAGLPFRQCILRPCAEVGRCRSRSRSGRIHAAARSYLKVGRAMI